jgi:hypothetical protein
VNVITKIIYFGIPVGRRVNFRLPVVHEAVKGVCHISTEKNTVASYQMGCDPVHIRFLKHALTSNNRLIRFKCFGTHSVNSFFRTCNYSVLRDLLSFQFGIMAIVAQDDLYRSFQYPWMCFNYFMVPWVLSHLVRELLMRMTATKTTFMDLSEDKQRNAAAYIVLLIGTTFAFCGQMYGGYEVFFEDRETTSEQRFNWLAMSMQSIIILYIWELGFRIKIGIPMLLHRLCTICLMQLASATFYDTKDKIYIRLALMVGFHATTEQSSYIALFIFRLKLLQKQQGLLFYVAAAQTFVVKTTVFLATAVYYCLLLANAQFVGRWGLFWKIFGLPALFILYAAQVYEAKGLFGLALKCSNARSPTRGLHNKKSIKRLLDTRLRKPIIIGQNVMVHSMSKTTKAGIQVTRGNETARLLEEGKKHPAPDAPGDKATHNDHKNILSVAINLSNASPVTSPITPSEANALRSIGVNSLSSSAEVYDDEDSGRENSDDDDEQKSLYLF